MNEVKNKRSILLNLEVDEKLCIYRSSVNIALLEAQKEIDTLNETIESIEALKLNCDKLDYAIAAGSGAICGIMDIFLVGKPGESPLGKITDVWSANMTKKFAELCGWNKEGDLSSAIRFLEKKFKVPYDQNGTGGIAKEVLELTPSNHHFKSLSHNPTLLGLFFSILDQFNNTSHFVSEGRLITIDNSDGDFELKGNNIPAKFVCAFVNWFGHIISDISGASGSKGRGMGIPSPLWCWMNDIIAIKSKLNIPASTFDKNVNDLAEKIFKLGFDSRFQTAQTIPVFVNEIFVRLLYAIRRMIAYFSRTTSEQRSFNDMWKYCEPFKNVSVRRMLTVAHGTFCLVDIGDATLKGFINGGGSFNVCEFFLRLNVAGVGRFTISLYGEIKRDGQNWLAEKNADFAKRQKHIVEYYINGLQELQRIYNDSQLIDKIEGVCTGASNGNVNGAFDASINLATTRGVPLEKTIKNREENDNYFNGGKK